MFFAGMIPYKGVGALCSDSMSMPISYVILIIGMLMISWSIVQSINNEDLIQIKDEKLIAYYKSLKYKVDSTVNDDNYEKN